STSTPPISGRNGPRKSGASRASAGTSSTANSDPGSQSLGRWKSNCDPGSEFLEGEAQRAHQRAGQPHAGSLSLTVGRRIRQQLALGREGDESLAEQAIDRLVEAHRRPRRGDAPAFHPERGEARHAGDAPGGAV